MNSFQAWKEGCFTNCSGPTPDVVSEGLARAKIVFFDVDGVFFSGKSIVFPEHLFRFIGARGMINFHGGETGKERSLVDGQGISFLRDLGLQIVFVTGESDAFISPILTKLNNLPSVKSGKWTPIWLIANMIGSEKLQACRHYLETFPFVEGGRYWDQVVYMGDDIGDLAVMKEVVKGKGVVVVPNQAEQIVKSLAHVMTSRYGGDGAIRDLANLMLSVRGIDPTTLALK